MPLMMKCLQRRKRCLQRKMTANNVTVLVYAFMAVLCHINSATYSLKLLLKH